MAMELVDLLDCQSDYLWANELVDLSDYQLVNELGDLLAQLSGSSKAKALAIQ